MGFLLVSCSKLEADEECGEETLLVQGKRKPLMTAARCAVLVIGLLSLVVLVAGLSTKAMDEKSPKKKGPPPPTKEEFPRQYSFRWGGINGNLSKASSLCSEFDDDNSFPSEVCDCGDARTQCAGNMLNSPRYHEVCFDESCGPENMEGFHKYPSDDPQEKCLGLSRPSWAVPCAWQAVLQLPKTCDKTFRPSAPFGTSQNVPNTYSPAVDKVLGWAETFAGPCNAHAFCYTCQDDNFHTGIHPFCQAVFHVYGATPDATTAPPQEGQKTTSSIHSFFDDLDTFWCRPDVLTSLKAFYRTQQRNNNNNAYQ